MYAQERQAAILDLARDAGRVEVARLAEELDVTPETVRRDLSALARTGLIRRVHGGAILAEANANGFEPALAVRESVHTREKARIAHAALDWLPEQGAIALDGGSTTHQFAEILPFDRALTVVTNNLAIALPLADRTDLTVHIVGGRLRGRTLTTVDEVALDYLRGVHLDVVFLGTNGFSIERGLTTPDSAEAAVKRAFVAAARTKVLLSDHTKYGRDHFAHVADLAQIDVVVTDTDLPDAAVANISAAGPQVIRA
ncbi:MAG: DeoR/GlpR family DNA-binding transcription regulator [Candidatus Nanopelagicales bacterium]